MDGSLPPAEQVHGAAWRRTLASAICCVGVGLHSGRRARLTLAPGEPGRGILFRRSDLGIDIPATADAVVDTRLNTTIGAQGARIGTIEHVMAALAGAGVDDAVVEVDGPEVPILDGSAEPFLFLLRCAGIARSHLPRRTIEVLKTVRVEDGGAFAELSPAPLPGFEAAMTIEFDAAAIGRQSLSLRVTEDTFRRCLADARTFTTAEEVSRARAAGLAKGGSLHNAVVVDGALVLNPGGLRHPDEFVRHKLLDAVGDLALAGAPIRGRFTGHRSGHALNVRLVRALLADSSAWRLSAPRAAVPRILASAAS
ncbi:MAG: UDP-3-O-acyl-N-acetylglucosamine deacetylase [Acetobacteraceae bacterium]|nr:UDP-3-O-acyl-N-acetylglucosamine deacetylase [Acetobacteraceae bacterium]MDW8398006.1 UDP-3-O-acyl-N-acetylglucosamine deacetylase [Acetobacteraceae bacterium]